MEWWAWLILGMVLMTAEVTLIDAAFYLIFLGVSAMVVGLIELMGLELSVSAQWVTFALIALASMVFLRKRLYESYNKDGGYESIPDSETITVDQELQPGAKGRVSYRGSDWDARNVGSKVIEAGSEAVIKSVNGIELALTDVNSNEEPGENG